MAVTLRRLSQTQWVIVSMILGVAVGYFFPDGKAAEFGPILVSGSNNGN